MAPSPITVCTIYGNSILINSPPFFMSHTNFMTLKIYIIIFHLLRTTVFQIVLINIYNYYIQLVYIIYSIEQLLLKVAVLLNCAAWVQSPPRVKLISRFYRVTLPLQCDGKPASDILSIHTFLYIPFYTYLAVRNRH